jgi:hypothetical protein
MVNEVVEPQAVFLGPRKMGATLSVNRQLTACVLVPLKVQPHSRTSLTKLKEKAVDVGR